MERYPKDAQIYIRVIITLGAITLLLSCWWPKAFAPDRLLYLFLGVVLSVIASFGKVPVTGNRNKDDENTSHISLGLVPTFLVLIVHGPLAAMIAGAVNTFITSMSPRRSYPHQILFSIGAINLSILAAALVLRAFGMAPIEQLEEPIFSLNTAGAELLATLRPYLGVILATATYYFICTGLVAHVIAMCSGQKTLSVWRDGFAWISTSYYAGTACAVFIVAWIPTIMKDSGLKEALPFLTIPAIMLLLAVPALMLLLHRYHWDNRIKQAEHIEELQRNKEALEKSNGELQRSQEQLQKLFHSTVESLALAIDAKDRYTREHIQRVRKIAVAIAKELGLNDEEVDSLATAALLHDIGKIAIPEHILNKPGRLNEEEMQRVREHPAMGARILEPVDGLRAVIPAVRSHHERWDGTGYPDHLHGTEIPLGGRILAVADVFDALTTDRSYRIGWSEEEALDYIRKNAGHHFDPQIVEAFFAVLERSPRLHIVDDTDERGTPPVPDPVTLGITRASFEYLSLYEISQTISATLNLEDTLTLLAEKIRKLFNATDCILLMPDAHGNLKVARCSGHHEQWFMEQGVYSGEGYTYRVLKTGEGYCGPFDSRDMPRYTDGVDTRFLPLRSVMVAPLLVDGEVFGTVNLYHERENAFDPEDMQVLCSVGAQSGRAIRNAQEYDRTLKSAYTDSLTGLPNARQLMISLDKAVEEARLGQYLLTILVLDLDDFKPVNDRYGHLTGNQVLTDIGQILHDSLRSGDFVARYAGDEFVVVLPKAGVSEAETVADKLRAAVTAYRPASPALADLQVGVSIGYAVFPTDGTDSIALIASADRAMYQDKNRRKHTTLTASLLTATK